MLGVEFAGGNTIMMNFTNRIGVDQLRASATKAGVGDVLSANQTDRANNRENLSVTTRVKSTEKTPEAGAKEEGPADKVVAQFKADFPNAGFQVAGIDAWDPQLALKSGRRPFIPGCWHCSASWSMSRSVMNFPSPWAPWNGDLHDILMTTGWYFLAGREMNATTVAALLTIIGFSINDTIVIFENLFRRSGSKR